MSSIVWWFLSSSAYIYFEFFWLFSCRDVFCRCLDLKVLMSYGSCRYVFLVIFFFFQAEDGIRDDLVTGVQTCALPICQGRRRAHGRPVPAGRQQRRGRERMSTPGSLLIQNGRVIDPANQVDAIADVLIEGTTIKRVGPKLAAPEGVETVDVTGKVVCPGLIDIHVHLREPGFEYKETVLTGTDRKSVV